MKTECNVNALLDCAVASAQAAGDHAISQQHRHQEADEVLAHDIKLALDRECQEAAEAVVRATYPTHAILGEESKTHEEHDWQWVIDPIDGTVNFFHGLPWWCNSVAVAYQGTVLAGAVNIPPLGQLYTATVDGPALCNGTPIQASSTDTLSKAMIATGLSKFLLEKQPCLTIFQKLSHEARKVRLMGAAAIDICHVASGAVDGYFETSIYWWDVAAAGLIAERAGATTERLEEFEGHRMRYMATNGSIHQDLKKAFTESFQSAEKPHPKTT